jgi:hypothetical protein
LDALEENSTIQHVELPTWVTDRHHYLEEYDRLAATIRRLAPQSLRIYHHSGGRLHCKVLATLLARGLVQLTTMRAVSILNREDVQVLADTVTWTCPDLVTLQLQHLRVRTHDERPLLDPLLIGLTQCPNLEHVEVSVSPCRRMLDCRFVESRSLETFLLRASKLQSLSLVGLALETHHLQTILEFLPASVLRLHLELKKTNTRPLRRNETLDLLIRFLSQNYTLEELIIPSIPVDETLVRVLQYSNTSLKRLELQSSTPTLDFWLELNRKGRQH